MSLLFFPRILIIFLGLILGCRGFLNLYLNKQETYRLLGVEYELYYVRNGIINQYALSFDLPLQPHVDELFFTWQSLRDQRQMFYKMSFNVSNPAAMPIPTANISENGAVPNQVSVFMISLPCSGTINAEVHLTIQMTISILSTSNPAVITFKRKKVCLKKKSSIWNPRANTSVTTSQSETSYHNTWNYGGNPRDKFRRPTNHTDTSDRSTSNHIFYAAVASICAIILLITVAVVAFYLKSPRNNDRYSKKINCYDSSSSQALTGQSQTFLRPDTPNNAGLPAGLRRGVSPSHDLKPTDVNSVLSEVLIDRKRISLGDLLMEGTFGRIYMGTLIGEDENEAGQEQDVFIKTVTDQARGDQVQLFLTECIPLKGLLHANLHPILGACLENPGQPLVLYAAMAEGNLKKFLLKCRMSECGSRYTLNTQQLVYMTIQIIRGIQYLHRKKLIHKDLATRNCLVDTELVVKVTDNALARDLFPGDYNCLGDNENRPVKWMAIEALQEKRFSTASDVWAFGVTLWELMTLGQQPYAEVDPFEMVTYLQEGYRIAKPHNCPDELFSLMACCWALTPDERPKFGQLLMYLQNFYMALGRYI